MKKVKRQYRNSLDFVEAGFVACWESAQDLVKGAKLLLDNGFHAQALSLSVLAVEEMGKLFCIDGLLYARSDDQKSSVFAQSLKSHSTKLSSIIPFPLLLSRVASVDPRYGVQERFHQTVAIAISDLKERGNRVLSLSEKATFQDLDIWKQSGFYAQPRDALFLKPNDAVKKVVAEAVYMFAWRAVTTLDFLLKGGNLKRYINCARSVRAKLSESEHQAIEEIGGKIAQELFPDQDDNDDESS
jgi:AbiV family abortive infection protein